MPPGPHAFKQLEDPIVVTGAPTFTLVNIPTINTIMSILPVPLLLLTLQLLSPVLAQESSAITYKFTSADRVKTKPGIVWANNKRDVFVRLNTPNLPLRTWNQVTKTWIIEDDILSALLFKVSLSDDNSTVILGYNTPLLPLPNPLVPPKLSVPHISVNEPDSSLPMFYGDDSMRSWEVVGLDYDRLSDPRDDRNIRYYLPSYTLRFNVLGVGFSHPEESNVLLDSDEQQLLIIKVKDHNGNSHSPPHPNLEITDVKIWPRESGYVHPRPRSGKECSKWSWRCEDFGDEPWYRYIWRQDFDDDGRIGSGRHWVSSHWDSFRDKLRVPVMVAGIVLAGLIGLASLVYGTHLWVKKAMVYLGKSKTGASEEEEAGLLDEEYQQPPPPYVELLERPLPLLPPESG